MTDQEIANLAQGFKDMPLEIRRDGWRRWEAGERSTDERTKWVVFGHTSGGIERRTKCCPWGSVIIAVAESCCTPYRPEYDGMPGYQSLGHLIGLVSQDTLYLSDEAYPSIKPFMHLIDSGRLTDDQIHRIMVPEDFTGGA